MPLYIQRVSPLFKIVLEAFIGRVISESEMEEGRREEGRKNEYG